MLPDVPRPGLSGFVMVALAAASWGTWSLFIRPTGLPTTVSGPVIFLVMGLTALPVALRGPPSTWDRRTIGYLIANAACDGLNLLAYVAALQQTTVAIAVLTHYLAPVLISLAAPRIDGVVTPGARIAAAVAMIGLVIILEPWHAPAEGAVVGGLLGIGSAFCYAGNVFATRRLVARIGPARAQAYRSLLAGVAMAPLLLLADASTVTLTGLGILTAGSVTIGAISGIVFSIGLMRIGSARAAVLTFVEPIIAVTVGAVIWGEPLHATAMLGGALVLGAGILVARNSR